MLCYFLIILNWLIIDGFPSVGYLKSHVDNIVKSIVSKFTKTKKIIPNIPQKLFKTNGKKTSQISVPIQNSKSWET